MKEPRWKFNQSLTRLILCGFSSWKGEGSGVKGFHQSCIHLFVFCFFFPIFYVGRVFFFFLSNWRDKRSTIACKPIIILKLSSQPFSLFYLHYFCLTFFVILCNFLYLMRRKRRCVNANQLDEKQRDTQNHTMGFF